MNLKLTKGSSAYIFELTPGIVISNEFVRKEDSSTPTEKLVTWTIDGYLAPSTTSILAQQIELTSFLSVDALTSAQLLDGTTVVESLSGDLGVLINKLDFPEGTGVQHATRRNYSFELSCRVTDTTVSSSGIYSYKIEYAVKQNTKVTRTISGTIKDFVTKDVLAKYTALKTAQAWMSWAASTLLSDTYSVNENNTICDFSIVHEQYWVVFPTGITNCEVSREVTTDAQGVQFRKFNGWFEGSEANCDAAISAEITGGYTISYTKTRNPFSNRTSFSAELLSNGNSSTYFSSETISITESLTGIIFKPVLGGGAPIKQTVGKKQARATQSGVIKQLSSYASAPALKWTAGDLVDKVVTREPLEYKGAAVGYVLTYQYVYEFTTTPSF